MDPRTQEIAAESSAQAPLVRPESPATRICGLVLAGLIVLTFSLLMFRTWLPVHGGVDQNGYMVGGKQLATTGSMALRPHRVDTGQIDPLQFVSSMWVGLDLGSDEERYLPKYPVGLPLIYAGMLKLGGAGSGVVLVHLVSPLSMALALLGVFLLARLLLGSVPALAVMILLAVSPATLALTNNPNSHAAALLLVTWGMYLLVLWWNGGSVIWGIVGAMLAGAATSIRYTEGLLVLPIAIMALLRVYDARPRNGPTLLQATAVLAAWAVPVVALLWHNRVAMGAWTGYDPTNESTGFAWKYFADNWDTMLHQLYAMGLMLLFPLALAGLVSGFVWHWRLALILAAWILPSLLLYTAYYWAPDGQTVGYSRFFLTILPPLAICAIGLLLWPAQHVAIAHPGTTHHRIHIAAVLATMLLLAISVPMGIATAQPSLESDFKTRKNLQQRADAVLRSVPSGSVLFCDARGLSEHLQLVSNYVLYSPEVFTRLMIDRLGNRNAEEPSPMDPGRAHYLTEMLRGKTQAELDALRDEIAIGALSSGKRVFTFTQANLGARRPPGWRMSNRSKLTMVPVMEGIDAELLPRPFPNGRPMAMMKRNLPTTLPRSTWQIMEITLRPGR